jgi:hypothetical protein
LQHYGYPIQAYRTAGQENSRITYQQFAYIIMGCLFDGWGDFAATNEEGLKWVELLGNIVGLFTEHRIDYSHQRACTWLVYLLVAARTLADLEEPEKKAADQLMKLSRRRSTFLHIPSQTPPLFGLSQIDVLLPLLQSDQQRVDILRQFWHTLGVDESDFLVMYQSPTKNPPHLMYSKEYSSRKMETRTEYATIQPYATVPAKLKDGQSSLARHTRWITLDPHQLIICNRRLEYFLDLNKATRKVEELKRLEKNDEEADRQRTRNGAEQESFARAPRIPIPAEDFNRWNLFGERCLPVVEYTTLISTHD